MKNTISEWKQIRTKFLKQNDYKTKIKRMILLSGEKRERTRKEPLVDGMIYVILYYYAWEKVHGNLINLLLSIIYIICILHNFKNKKKSTSEKERLKGENMLMNWHRQISKVYSWVKRARSRIL